MIHGLYGSSLAMLTDLYEITMAYGYWKTRVLDRHAAFHVTFRAAPFGGAYAIACGLHYVVEYLRNFRFDQSDLDYLASLKGNDEKPLFEPEFLGELASLRLSVDVDAVPEGTAVFPHQPLVRVTGPILQCQILESALLNFINFQTLVATKASRVCYAARGEPVIEFGLRRAQNIDGSLAAARAAYIGGCVATSNTLAGKLFDIPVKGTHAHSWIMSFDDELESFRAYARAMPNNCIFLVDTYDTLQGVRNAIAVGKELRDRGHRMLGIRLDSGDLAVLSIEARKMLDDAGFHDASIVASNELDEHLINSLKDQDAKVNVWGVGTRLATAYDQPALGGVYKLSALRMPGRPWQHKIKLSEQTAKVSVPGILQIRRFSNSDGFIADAIYDTLIGIGDAPTLIDPMDISQRQAISAGTQHQDLLVPIFRKGKCVYKLPHARQARKYARQQLDALTPPIKRFDNPQPYFVGLEQKLFDLRLALILKARGISNHRYEQTKGKS